MSGPRITLENGYVLRLMKEDDVCPAYVSALNDSGRVHHMTSLKAETTAESAIAYVRENSGRNDVLFFGVFDREELLGTSRLHDIDGRTASMGIFIFSADPARKGLGTSVIRAISDFAFTELGLASVHAGIFSDNIASVRAFEKAGFTETESGNYEGRTYTKWVRNRA